MFTPQYTITNKLLGNYYGIKNKIDFTLWLEYQ